MHLIKVAYSKALFIQNHNNISIQPIEPAIQIGNITMPISLIKSKDMYNNLIINKIKPPRSFDCWIDIYPFLEAYYWKHICSVPFKFVLEALQLWFSYFL